jgi:UDP-GlcNAc:undecaprenyl-phosphate GlcNAc-1-phosphate transferase
MATPKHAGYVGPTSEEMIYLFISVILFLVINLYFRIATRIKIIDIPNERSSHTKPTIRGGGIIIPLSILLLPLFSEDANIYLIGAIILSGAIAFFDDLISLSPVIRLLGYIGSIILAFYGLEIISLPTFYLIFILIVVAGVLNAFNFMDGINGITALYSIIALGTLIYLNNFLIFIDQQFLALSFCATVVFAYYNVRKKARCFAGDVGAVSIAMIIVIGVISLIRSSNEFTYILFLAVYGVDSVLTIIHRLLKKENIFQAHRSHLYQYLTNQKGFSHLKVAAIYAGVQLFINIFIIASTEYNWFNWYMMYVIVLLPLGILYIVIKRKIILEEKKYSYS